MLPLLAKAEAAPALKVQMYGASGVCKISQREAKWGRGGGVEM